MLDFEKRTAQTEQNLQKRAEARERIKDIKSLRLQKKNAKIRARNTPKD